MDARELARLEHENMIEAFSAAGALAPNARVERADGVALVLTGLPLRLFNQVLVEGDDAGPDALASAVAAARGRGDRFIVSLRAGTDDRFLPLMERLGLVRASEEPWMPGMAMHPLPPCGVAAPLAGHEIRRVADGPGIADHIHTAAAGFEMPVDWVEAIVSEELAARPGIAVYVGYVNGAPVTTGLGARTSRTIGVYNIATVESARRRGYGAAMTRRIVEDGAAAGCDVAILQATEMGYPIYERMGFRTVVEYLGFVDPASLSRLPDPTAG